jgi:hypothetical protein
LTARDFKLGTSPTSKLFIPIERVSNSDFTIFDLSCYDDDLFAWNSRLSTGAAPNLNSFYGIFEDIALELSTRIPVLSMKV